MDRMIEKWLIFSEILKFKWFLIYFDIFVIKFFINNNLHEPFFILN